MNNPFFYAVIMLLSGLGIPLMAALNGSLGVKLQSPVLAAVFLFSLALLIAVSVLLVSEGTSFPLSLKSIPWYLFFGGFFIAFYVLNVTWVAPRFGVANAVSFVLLGQLIAMSLIDHFGFFGLPQYSFTSQRAIGLVLMAAGVFLVVNRGAG